MIVGHGGTKIDRANPAPDGELSCDWDGFNLGPEGTGKDGLVTTVSRHGLMIWDRVAASQTYQSGWVPSYMWAGSSTLYPTAGTEPAEIDGCRN